MKLFLWIDGKQDGPFEPEQIRELLGKGSIAAVTLACPEDGTGEWKPISSYEGIAEPLQPVEPAPAPAPAPAPDPPEQKSNFRWKPVVISSAVLLVLILAMAGYHQNRKAWQDVQNEEADWKKEKYQSENPSPQTLRSNGVNQICEDCSNSVVGLSRIVKVYVEYDEKASNWWGEATYEFVNKVGGVERENKWYLFHIATNSTGGTFSIYPFEDDDAKHYQERALRRVLKKFGISSP